MCHGPRPGVDERVDDLDEVQMFGADDAQSGLLPGGHETCRVMSSKFNCQWELPLDSA